MKGIDIFCASQAATSIRLSMEESGGSTTSTIYLGGNTSGRALDRYNPIIRDATRITKVLLNTSGPPCSSSNQPPISPKPHHHHQKNSRKNPSKENNNHHHQNKKIISSKQNDDSSSSKKKSFSSSWSCTKPGEFISPPGSSRYLLTTQKSSFLSDHFDPLLAMVPVGPHSTAPDQAVDHKKDDIVVVDVDDDDSSSSANTSKLPNSSSSSSASSADQVFLLLPLSFYIWAYT